MIEEGLGIGILPAAILRHTNYHLNAIPFDPPITREIGIAYLNRHMLPVAAGRFIEFLAEQCTDA
jgi:DNA-binding transcriptional LysR family regulator